MTQKYITWTLAGIITGFIFYGFIIMIAALQSSQQEIDFHCTSNAQLAAFNQLAVQCPWSGQFNTLVQPSMLKGVVHGPFKS